MKVIGYDHEFKKIQMIQLLFRSLIKQNIIITNHYLIIIHIKHAHSTMDKVYKVYYIMISGLS